MTKTVPDQPEADPTTAPAQPKKPSQTDLQVINNARQFLLRVQLNGNEVPAFIEVMNLLARVEAGGLEPPA